MDSDLWPKAKQSLQILMENFPDGVEPLLEAIENGTIDGSEEDAIIRYFELMPSEEDPHILASGMLSNLCDMPPIEAFALSVRPGDTNENNEELTLICGELKTHLKRREDEFFNAQYGEEYAAFCDRGYSR